MRELLRRFAGAGEGCGCTPAFERDRLIADANGCAGRGRLADSPACRATAVEALTERDADAVVTRAGGLERAYEDDAAALLVAAGRFVERAVVHDAGLAARARRDPLRAAREAAGRAGATARIAAETGLVEGAMRVEGYDRALRPYVGPTVAGSRVAARPPPDARLVDERDPEGDPTVRVYEQPGVERRTYHLEPVEARLDAGAAATLAAAYERLAAGDARGDRAPGRAVRQAAGPDDPVETLAAVLRKHTRGYGALEDLFADPGVSDVFATAPVERNPLRVRVDGEPMHTNVRLTADGAEALASRFRRESGRAFSRASPTLDATATVGGRELRVAGVAEPVSEGIAFAFRAGGREAWTLPALVRNDTLPAAAAALLSLAGERAAAILVAGARGAGKTTLLSALLWELPATTRIVVIEDTPELPVPRLQRAGRDVQALRVASGDGPGLDPADALRTALRLGEGALVVGEVRGAEARVLYEAMRVGASGGAVLGTIHGAGGAAVRERVVSDLGVPATSFAATDLLVTLETAGDGARRVAAVEEVVDTDDGVRFATLYERADDRLVPTGRIGRGDSRLVAGLSRPDEGYAAVRDALADREAWLADVVERGHTDLDSVVEAHACRRGRC